MRGTMIWFNAEKGFGFIRTEEDERLYVAASGFLPGAPPEGRCAGKDVVFERLVVAGDPRAVGVVFPEVVDLRRARQRRPRVGRSL
jgi:cold shock CspA family protein